MGWISGQFTTRVIVLMPVAIAINIVLGYTIQTVLKAADLHGFDRHDLCRCARGAARRRADRHPDQPDLAVRAGHRRRNHWPVRHHRRRDRPAGRSVGLPGRLSTTPGHRYAAVRGCARRRGNRRPRRYPDLQQPRLHGSQHRRLSRLGIHGRNRDRCGRRDRAWQRSSTSNGTWQACGLRYPAS